MPNPWYPAANRDPGVSAGYVHGQVISVVSCVVHYTVGVNSRGLIRDEGLAEFLIDRDGTIWQFSEADAICYHAGYPYNGRGPGIEVEYYPDTDPVMFTDAARTATGGLVRWLNSEWGIPLDYYDNPDARTADHHGFISHRSVIEDAAYHNDYWPRPDWDQMLAPTPTPAPLPEDEDDMPQTKGFVVGFPSKYGDAAIYCRNDEQLGACSTWIGDNNTVVALVAAGVIDQRGVKVLADIFAHYPLVKGTPDPRK